MAGFLAYITPFPALVLLVLPQFRARPYVRFHAWQSLLFYGASVLLMALLLWVGTLAIVNCVLLFLGPPVVFALFLLWIVLLIKAWHGVAFQLPGLGALALRRARA